MFPLRGRALWFYATIFRARRPACDGYHEGARKRDAAPPSILETKIGNTRPQESAGVVDFLLALKASLGQPTIILET